MWSYVIISNTSWYIFSIIHMKIKLFNHKKHRTMKTIPIHNTKNSSHYYRSYPLKRWRVTVIFFANKCKIVILAIWECHLRSKQSISNTRSTSQHPQPKRSTFERIIFSWVWLSQKAFYSTYKVLRKENCPQVKNLQIFFANSISLSSHQI